MRVLPALLAFSVLVAGCRGPYRAPASVVVDYLGHASFLLTLPNGVTVLTDYGTSNAWGLDSPIHPLDGLVPDVATFSHAHADHAGGPLPEGVRTLGPGGGGTEWGGLRITPIPTYEGGLQEPDNLSFLFEYGSLKILHLGDCQGLIVGLRQDSDPLRIAERIRRLYPDRYDLVLLPIGFTEGILPEARLFLSHIEARHVIPMHYWIPSDRDRFLDLMEEEGLPGKGPVAVSRVPGSRWTLEDGADPEALPLVLGLVPGPVKGRGGS